MLREHSSNKFTILIIDDIDIRNIVLKIFIKYLCLSKGKLENMVILFSYNENIEGDIFKGILDSLRGIKEFEEYKMRLFNEYNTQYIIGKIFGNKYIEMGFAKEVYKYTLGNPSYIKSFVKKYF
ncbi:hypothetical protein JCM1393_02260 [Clostridium carnis]